MNGGSSSVGLGELDCNLEAGAAVSYQKYFFNASHPNTHSFPADYMYTPWFSIFLNTHHKTLIIYGAIN